MCKPVHAAVLSAPQSAWRTAGEPLTTSMATRWQRPDTLSSLAAHRSLPPLHPALTQAPDVRLFLVQQHALEASLQDSRGWQRTYLGKGQSANYRISQEKSASVSDDHRQAAICAGPQTGAPALYVYPINGFRMPFQHTYKYACCC